MVYFDTNFIRQRYLSNMSLVNSECYEAIEYSQKKENRAIGKIDIYFFFWIARK
jgi:hypothetical protein